LIQNQLPSPRAAHSKINNESLNYMLDSSANTESSHTEEKNKTPDHKPGEHN